MASERPIEAETPGPIRRPSLGDALIGVAATAVGIAAARETILALLRVNRSARSANPFAQAAVFGWMIASWTLALVLIRLRTPRPSWRRLGRQPGLIAALAALLAIAYKIGTNLPRLAVVGPRLIFLSISPAASDAAPVVASAWMALALAGAWEAEPGWIDRLGRLLGATWIALPIATAALRSWA